MNSFPKKSGAFEATLTGKWSFLMHSKTCGTMYIWCTLMRIRWLRLHKIWDWTVSTLLVLLPSCRSGLSAGVPPSALWLITARSGHFSPAYFFSVLIFSPSRPFLFVVRAILNEHWARYLYCHENGLFKMIPRIPHNLLQVFFGTLREV